MVKGLPKGSKAKKAAKGPRGPVGIRKNPVRRARPPRSPVITVTGVTTCAARKAKISGRTDEAELLEHYDAIATHRAKQEARIEGARAYIQKLHLAKVKNKGELIRKERRSIPAFKAKITEAKGENAATDFMVDQYPNSTLQLGFAAGIGFDQIWYDATTDTFHIVEAKGPGAGLGDTLFYGKQMSKQWVEHTLQAMITSSTRTANEKAMAARMLAGIKNGQPPPKVKGLVVEAKVDANGVVNGAVTGQCPDGEDYN